MVTITDKRNDLDRPAFSPERKAKELAALNVVLLIVTFAWGIAFGYYIGVREAAALVAGGIL